MDHESIPAIETTGLQHRAEKGFRSAPRWLCLFVGLLAAACNPNGETGSDNGLFESAQPARNLVLITLDTTRHDIIGAYGHPEPFTPNVDAVAARGLVFENAYSTAPFTGPAHASILTGQHPSTHGIIYNGSRVMAKIDTGSTSLAEHLAALGFATGAVVSNGVLHERYGFARGFSSYTFHNEAQPDDKGGSAEGVRDLAVEWLDTVGDERFFLWVHFIEPHLPYVVSEAVQQKFQLEDRFIDIQAAKHTPRPRLQRIYGGDVYEADLGVGAVLDHLKALGRLEETLVVITSDHGEYLHEHGLLDHSRLYEPVLHVPLVIAGPGVAAGGRRTELVSVIDLPDTITDGLGLAPLASSQGTSQWGRSDGRGADRAVFAEWRHYRMVLEPDRVNPNTDFLVSAQQGKTKVILPALEGGRPQLFDLAEDRGEVVNRYEQRPELATHLVTLHRDHVSEDLPRGILGPDGVELDGTTIDMLRELGYVE
jgi:arylsulfatase A-like enzyme